ncbi:hypothetical protein PCI56_23920 [Plesiomonas shigelloides subsp. oncorhynchi]|nr:hypothetical protein [Plesiomonas shigelloides]
MDTNRLTDIPLGAIWSFFDTLPEGAMNKGRAIVSGLIDGITAKWRDLMDAVKA